MNMLVNMKELRQEICANCKKFLLIFKICGKMKMGSCTLKWNSVQKSKQR